MGEKAYFVCVPTSAGTGSEVTPFAVITDEQTGVKYPLADYALMPNMAIVDADMQMMAPPGLTSASGIDAVSHALEAYASMMATDYTDGLAIRALQVIFKYLPQCYDAAVAKKANPVAREKMANAATMAGMAFANAFLGVMHSMAHKLGAFHHIPHGIANALMMEQVLRFNADPTTRTRSSATSRSPTRSASRASPRASSSTTSSRPSANCRRASASSRRSATTCRTRRTSSTASTRWWSRPSTTSAPARTRAIR